MKFSVIIPVYNSQVYLSECLESLIVQSCEDWEAICVDDGSTDDSGRILDEFAARDGRINVLHMPNRGVGMARNAGLDNAEGEWVCFLDSDDTVDGEWLATYESLIRVHPSSRLVWLCRGEQANRMASDVQVLNDGAAYAWCLRTFSVFGALWMGAIRRDIVGKARLPKLSYKEDSAFLFSLCPEFTTVVLNSSSGYCYRQTPGSLSKRRLSAEHCLTYLRFCKNLWEEQRVFATACGQVGLLEDVVYGIAAHDVVEWAKQRCNIGWGESQSVRRAFGGVLSAGVRSSAFMDGTCYRVPFMFWRMTGLVFGFQCLALYRAFTGALRTAISGR